MTLHCRLSLVGRIHKMIPECEFWILALPMGCTCLKVQCVFKTHWDLLGVTYMHQWTGSFVANLLMNCGLFKSLATWLFAQQLVQANNRENIKGLYYWPFVSRLLQWSMYSPIKGAVMQKARLCHESLMNIHIPSITASISAWSESVHIVVHTLRPTQNGHHFANDIFKFVFLY